MEKNKEDKELQELHGGDVAEKEAPKESPKKEVKKKKQSPKPKPKKAKKMVHIDSFIEAIRVRVDISDAQAKGFKAYMTGNHYAKSLDEFVPKLEKYLGKKVG